MQDEQEHMEPEEQEDLKPVEKEHMEFEEKEHIESVEKERMVPANLEFRAGIIMYCKVSAPRS